VLYRVTPGDVCLQTFSCLVENRDYSAEGVAESDLVAEIIPPPDFSNLMMSDGDFRDRVFRAVARRFADFEQLVEDIALTGLASRLARAILRLAAGGDEIDTTHDQLARETASGRAAVSRQLAHFADEGLVELERGHIILADRAGLEFLAGSASP
jgi:CRP/FNR family transcriptional regulator